MRGRPSRHAGSPYRLHGLLRTHGITQEQLRKRLRFPGGHAMASTTLSLLLTQQVWPMTMHRTDIERAVQQLLTEHGVPEDEIKTAWEIGTADPQDRSHSDADRPSNANSSPVDAFEPQEIEMLSASAREHFKLPRHPFVDDVQGPSDVYVSRDQRYIRESMYYAAKHSGFLAVIGESGSGKTTLRRDLLDRIKRDNDKIVIIQPQTVDKTTLTAAHICDAIIADLSEEAPKLSLEGKARQVQRILASSGRAGNAHALVIEEAHDLKIPTLKYTKRFWEMEDGFRKLLGIILVGQPELGEKLDERRHPDLREVIRRCEVAHVRALDAQLEEYLTLKFKRVGVQVADVLAPDAYDAIRSRLTRQRPGTREVESNVYPIVVQNLLAKAMNAAVEIGMPRVDAALIGRI